MTRPSVLRAVKEDLVACGKDELETPDVRLDIEEDGDFTKVADEDILEESTFLEMSSKEEQAAHARSCILRGYSPSIYTGESVQLTRAQQIWAIEYLDPPMTPEERQELAMWFCVEDDSRYFHRQDQVDDAWRAHRPARGALVLVSS